MRRVLPLTVVFWGWLSMPALAVDAERLLEQLAQAEQQQSFSGTFVYGVAGGLSSHDVWHRAANGQVRERFSRLDGEPAEVLRVDGTVQCATDQYASEVAGSSGWQSVRLDPKLLQIGYEIRSLGQSRIAGRAVEAIGIVPRDQHRFGLELYLDQETSLPLKVLLLGENGQLLERYQYTRFQPGPVAEQALKPITPCQPLAADVEVDSSGSAWQAEWVPPGFRLLAAGVRPSPAGQGEVDWLTYGDGLAKFSVFVEPATGPVPSDERTQVGPVSAVSKRIGASQGDVMVTVLGEIPLGTAERIALSMRTKSEQSQ